MYFITERLLLAKARRGNSQAFAKLYDEYVDQIYRFILFKVSGVEVAQDLSADTFMKAWQYLQKGAEVKSFKAFLYKVARNLIIDQYRSASQATLPLEAVENVEGPSLEHEIAIKADIEDLTRMLMSLKDEWREVMILRHVEGMSMKEIARITEKNEGAIRVLLHRAHKALQELNSSHE